MANKNPAIQFKAIVAKLNKVLVDSVKASSLKATATFARDIVVKRTRLGYGVPVAGGSKELFKKLSPNYVKQRKMFAGLNALTRPNKSNLTRTGQMLDSIAAHTEKGAITIRPTGTRRDGQKNYDIAKYNEDGGKGRPRRIFMNISQLEFNQVKRFYRKMFGDLVKSRK